MYKPSNPRDLSDMARELGKVSLESRFPHVDGLRLTQLAAAPVKPQDGDIRYADGVNWNPGAGAGVYVFRGGAWALLG